MDNWLNYAIVVVIVAWAVWYSVRKVRSTVRGENCCAGSGKGGCSGNCSACSASRGCTLKKRA